MPIDWDRYAEAQLPAPIRKPAFDPTKFAALPLPEKLDAASHEALSFKMRLIASTDPETDDIQKVKAALSAAQSLLHGKIKVDETQFHAKQEDRTQEYLERFNRIARELAERRLKPAELPRFNALLELGLEPDDAEQATRDGLSDEQALECYTSAPR